MTCLVLSTRWKNNGFDEETALAEQRGKTDSFSDRPVPGSGKLPVCAKTEGLRQQTTRQDLNMLPTKSRVLPEV